MMMTAYPDAPGTPLSASRRFPHSYPVPVPQTHAQQRERQQMPAPLAYSASQNQSFVSSSMPSYSNNAFMTQAPHPSPPSHAAARPISPAHPTRALSLDRAHWSSMYETPQTSDGTTPVAGSVPTRSISFPTMNENIYESQINRVHDLSPGAGMGDRKLKPLDAFPDGVRPWPYDNGMSGDAPQQTQYPPLPRGHSQYSDASYGLSLAATQPYVPTGSMTFDALSDRLRAGHDLAPPAQAMLPSVALSSDIFKWHEISHSQRFDLSTSPVHSSVSDGKEANSPRSVHSASPSHHSGHSEGKDIYDDSGAAAPAKKKRRRASGKQLEVLNGVYARTAFPTTEERHELARQLDMSPRSVQIWFQNRRQSQRERRPMGASPLAPNLDRVPKRNHSPAGSIGALYPMPGTTFNAFDFQVGAAADPALDARSAAPILKTEDTPQLESMRRGRPRRVHSPSA